MKKLTLLLLLTATIAYGDTATFTITKNKLRVNDFKVWDESPGPILGNAEIVYISCSHPKYLKLQTHHLDRAIDAFPKGGFKARVEKTWNDGYLKAIVSSGTTIRYTQNHIYISKEVRHTYTHNGERRRSSVGDICTNTMGQDNNAVLKVTFYKESRPEPEPDVDEETTEETPAPNKAGLIEGTVIAPIKGAPSMPMPITTLWASLKRSK